MVGIYLPRNVILLIPFSSSFFSLFFMVTYFSPRRGWCRVLKFKLLLLMTWTFFLTTSQYTNTYTRPRLTLSLTCFWQSNYKDNIAIKLLIVMLESNFGKSNFVLHKVIIKTKFCMKVHDTPQHQICV